MMSNPTTDTKPNENEAEKLARLLELELVQKRAQWKQASARRQNARIMSFTFLFLIIMGCLAGLYFAFSMVNGERPKPQGSTLPAEPKP
jgi:hypothetical protein